MREKVNVLASKFNDFFSKRLTVEPFYFIYIFMKEKKYREY